MDPNEECFWIPNEKQISKKFRCNKFPGKCLYSTAVACNLDRHVEACTDESTIRSKQTPYGADQNPCDLAIESGVLPPGFKEYRQHYVVCWDIETLESKENCDVEHGQLGILKPISIATSTNIPNQEDQVYVEPWRRY